MSSNEFDDVERRLGVIEKALDRLDADEGPRGRRRDRARPDCPAASSCTGPGWRSLGGDPAGTREHAQRAVELAPDDDDLTRASAGRPGRARGVDDRRPRGRTQQLHRRRRRVFAASGTSPTSSAAASPSPTSRPPRAGSGRHSRPSSTLSSSPPARTRGMRGTRDMHTGLAQLAVERNDLRRGRRAPAPCGRAGRGRRAAAEPVPVAGRAGARCARPRVTSKPRSSCSRRPNGSTSATSPRTCSRSRRMRARHAGRRRRRSPRRWTGRGEQGLSPEDDLSYLREYEHVTLARVLLARHASDG